jgi:hypothetical protein
VASARIQRFISGNILLLGNKNKINNNNNREEIKNNNNREEIKNNNNNKNNK